MDITDPTIDSRCNKTNLMRQVSFEDNDSIRDYIDIGNEKDLNKLKDVINIKNSTYRTALMYAVISGSYDFVEDLITLTSGTIDLNVQDIDGKTALMYAVDFYNPDIFELLVKAGADLNIQNKCKQTAYDLAKKKLAFLTEGTEKEIKKRLEHDGRDRKLDPERIKGYNAIIEYIESINADNNSKKSGGQRLNKLTRAQEKELRQKLAIRRKYPYPSQPRSGPKTFTENIDELMYKYFLWNDGKNYTTYNRLGEIEGFGYSPEHLNNRTSPGNNFVQEANRNSRANSYSQNPNVDNDLTYGDSEYLNKIRETEKENELYKNLGGKKRKTKKGKRGNKSKESRKGKKSRKERKSIKGKKIKR